eukprot:TRINITY_DN23681_c0_g1_i1.p1 TRINITY_DN23681_c0_g1~~TRINITY_DN23681_c0_g1_i1.p1  ORF type:complete len:147 (-),score=49.24 TRINITY_DN23681_c0_g1_i1:206-646(-)
MLLVLIPQLLQEVLHLLLLQILLLPLVLQLLPLMVLGFWQGEEARANEEIPAGVDGGAATVNGVNDGAMMQPCASNIKGVAEAATGVDVTGSDSAVAAGSASPSSLADSAAAPGAATAAADGAGLLAGDIKEEGNRSSSKKRAREE